MMRIGYVEFYVTDLERSVRFATDILNLHVTQHDDKSAWLSCGTRDRDLVITANERAGCARLGLEVDRRETLLALKQSVEAGGLDIVPGDEEECFRFTLPEGHAFEAYVQRQPITPPRRPTLGHRFRKLGHYSIKTERIDELERIFTETLGFRVSDRVPGQLAWLRCGPDHHGLGLVAGPPGLHHYAFEVESWGSLENLGDHLAAEDVMLTWGPGRHGPGNNLFTYLLDPVGALVEVFADLVRVEDGEAYEARDWPDRPETVNIWGPGPPPSFLEIRVPFVEQGAGAP